MLQYAKLVTVQLAIASALAGCAPMEADIARLAEPVIYPLDPVGAELVTLGDLLTGQPAQSKSSWLERFLYGPPTRARSLLRNPQGMAYHDGQLYVCDQGLPDVVSIDLSSGQIRRWIRLEDRPACPVDVTVDLKNTVYVADTTQRAVLVYEPSGRLVSKLRPDGAGEDDFRPSAVLVSNDLLYIGDTRKPRIHRYDLSRGRWLDPLAPPEDAYPLGAPTGLALTSEGTLLIADALQAVVHRVGADGEWLAPLGARGRGAGQFVRPQQVTATVGGLVIVSDAAKQTLQVFDEQGRFLLEIPQDEAQRDPHGFTLPSGLTSISGADAAPVLLRIGWEERPPPETLIIASDALGVPSLRLFGVRLRPGGNSIISDGKGPG